MNSKTLSLIALVALTATYLATNSQTDDKIVSDFANFKAKYSKQYSTSEEEQFRFFTYCENMKKAEEHNASGSSYTMGETLFADLTQEEFKASMAMKNVLTQQDKLYHKNQENTFHSETYSGDVNWVTKGAVQAVKDQGICGSCWAFSAAACCESADFIFNGHLGDFSEKQLMSCSEGPTGGCQGGWPFKALQYYTTAPGFCTEAGYPYNIYIDYCHDKTCPQTSPAFKISGYQNVTSGSTASLRSACDKQPVSIAIDSASFGLYKGGIMDTCPENPGPDHAVLLAGYTDTYYLIKNSWGATWGENGYIRVTTKPDNCIGVSNWAVVPTV